MKNLEKLMDKKKDGKPLDENYKAAKMSMLEALRDHMSDMMKGDLVDHKNKAAVQVAADNKDDLAAGLDKAKELVGGDSDEGDDSQGLDLGSDDIQGMAGSDEDSKDEDGQEPGEKMIADMIAHEGAEDELSPQDIDALMELLQKMKMKKGMM